MKNYFPALTGIRAIAAFLVYFHHFRPVGLTIGLNRIFSVFHVGVTFFFVLSGFLICYRYYEKVDLLSRKGFLTYFINRFARIFPMYLLLTIATFLVSNNRSKIVWLLNLTLTKGFFNDLKFTGIAQGWTLTVEECFYLSAPVIFLLIKKYKFFWLQIIALLSIGCIMVILFARHSIGLYGFFGSFNFMFICTFFGRCLVLPIFISILFYNLIFKESVFKSVLSSKIGQTLGKSSYIFYLIHMGIIHTYLASYISDNIYFNFIILNLISIATYYLLEEPINKLIRRLFIEKKEYA